MNKEYKENVSLAQRKAMALSIEREDRSVVDGGEPRLLPLRYPGNIWGT